MEPREGGHVPQNDSQGFSNGTSVFSSDVLEERVLN